MRDAKRQLSLMPDAARDQDREPTLARAPKRVSEQCGSSDARGADYGESAPRAAVRPVDQLVDRAELVLTVMQRSRLRRLRMAIERWCSRSAPVLATLLSRREAAYRFHELDPRQRDGHRHRTIA
jgi:hypothetical protein